jgi:hypothetical protein
MGYKEYEINKARKGIQGRDIKARGTVALAMR